jgi:hypothetical protein
MRRPTPWLSSSRCWNGLLGKCNGFRVLEGHPSTSRAYACSSPIEGSSKRRLLRRATRTAHQLAGRCGAGSHRAGFVARRSDERLDSLWCRHLQTGIPNARRASADSGANRMKDTTRRVDLARRASQCVHAAEASARGRHHEKRPVCCSDGESDCRVRDVSFPTMASV